MVEYVWLIIAFPAAAFLIICAAFLPERRARFAPFVLITALSGCTVVALLALKAAAQAQHMPGLNEAVEAVWLEIGDLKISVGTLVDPLSATMMVVVSVVSLLIQIYSMGYMKGDPGYGRYFAYMSLFTTSMLGLVVSSSLLELYVFWELVGLCSYLLIGFWYRKPEAASAAKKAFVVTRFGDVGFLIGIIWLSRATGTFDFVAIEQLVKSGALASVGLTWIALLIFSGAVGKSAQFPLHVWLPDAMEGPTPVSALIHAATMVAAGVYLVARMYTLIQAAPYAHDVIAVIGGITALLAASIALAQDDIKRVLAYSTISQLGYMMLALGIGGYFGGVFHLVTHAFFKALLFLCAGSVIHALGTNNLSEMGGLYGRMKVTAITCLIGALALSGVAPFSGFFSKDAVLAAALFTPGADLPRQIIHYPLFVLALFVVFLTAFYMFRLWFLAFAGRPTEVTEPAQPVPTAGRGPRKRQQAKPPLTAVIEPVQHRVHESPKRMTIPMVVLAILAAISGLGLMTWFGHFLGQKYEGSHGMAGYLVMVVSSLVAFGGIWTAWRWYGKQAPAAERFEAMRLHSFLRNKWYIDQGYAWFVRQVVLVGATVFAWIDRHIVNGFVDGAAWLTGWLGARVRRWQTGQLQWYAMVIFLGVVLGVIAMTWLRVHEWPWGWSAPR